MKIILHNILLILSLSICSVATAQFNPNCPDMVVCLRIIDVVNNTETTRLSIAYNGYSSAPDPSEAPNTTTFNLEDQFGNIINTTPDFRDFTYSSSSVVYMNFEYECDEYNALYTGTVTIDGVVLNFEDAYFVDVDNDGDGLVSCNDPSDNDPCYPDPNSIACPTGDTDGDGIPNNLDSDPNNPNVPIETVTIDCNDLIQQCGPALVDFAEDYLLIGASCKQWKEDCSSTLEIYRNGTVAIGTNEVPAGFNMAVNGTITSEQYKVCSTMWCDYVFEEGYKRLSPEELQCYIEDFGHLPGVPSAATIEADGGIDLKESTLFQQEKIEELFLYLIELDQEMAVLEKELNKI